MQNDNWGFPETEAKKSTDFYDLTAGDHKMRVLTQPIPVRSYYKDGAFTQVDEDYKGPEKVILRGWVWAIIRGGEEIKIVKLPYSVIKMIQQLRADSEYAFDDFPMPYDITIKATGEKLTREYVVSASRKNTAVTAVEQAELEKKTPIADIVQKIRDKKEESQDEVKESKELPQPTEDINISDIPF